MTNIFDTILNDHHERVGKVVMFFHSEPNQLNSERVHSVSRKQCRPILNSRRYQRQSRVFILSVILYSFYRISLRNKLVDQSLLIPVAFYKNFYAPSILLPNLFHFTFLFGEIKLSIAWMWQGCIFSFLLAPSAAVCLNNCCAVSTLFLGASKICSSYCVAK